MSKDGLTDEDKELFRQMMQSVTPSRPSKIYHEEKKPSTVKPVRFAKTTSPMRQEVYTNTSITQPVYADTILSFNRTDLLPKRQKQLKNGLIPIEARLDLHGYYSEQAKILLCDFLEKAYQQARRCVLIIHGKGGKHNEAPLLKNHVNDWLQQIPQVLAFHSAHPRHGGAGAVYVLLKRPRAE